MSGSKRKSGYRKNVTKSYDDDIPELVEGVDIIAKVKANRGSNLFDVEIPSVSITVGSTDISNTPLREHVAILTNITKS